MIEFDHVSKHYGRGQDALRDISFELERGGLTFLIGHSGAGKSTLLRMIMPTEHPSKGKVVVNGHDLKSLSGRKLPQYRRSLGVVFQDHQLLADRTVFDNVALPLRVSGFSHRDMGRRVRAALDKVGLLGKERAMPGMLSAGERQRVGVARAVVNRPSVILADEPTGNLDPALSGEIMDLFEQFSQMGACVLIASHDLALVARYQHRLLSLDRGCLLSGGDA
ncbi:MAG: cell division ATP-binding protein FtsE [Gammaproteobacteria bacterium]|nr:cell division ATP-binding protein FtsE [Gammaproteobacteria bacterium]